MIYSAHPNSTKVVHLPLKNANEFGLTGLLPHQVETLEQQVARMYMQYQEHQTNLAKNIYLNVLHDYNETLFYQTCQPTP